MKHTKYGLLIGHWQMMPKGKWVTYAPIGKLIITSKGAGSDGDGPEASVVEYTTDDDYYYSWVLPHGERVCFSTRIRYICDLPMTSKRMSIWRDYYNAYVYAQSVSETRKAVYNKAWDNFHEAREKFTNVVWKQFQQWKRRKR